MTVKPDSKVRWTDVLRRKCEPSLGSVQEMDKWPPVATAWQRVRERYLEHVDTWRAGESQTTAPAVAVMRKVDASFASETPPPSGSLDLEIEAVRGAMCGAVDECIWYTDNGCSAGGDGESEAMLDFWCAHSGLAFTVLALLRTEERRRYGDRNYASSSGWSMFWLARPSKPNHHGPSRPWRRMRRTLVAAQWCAADQYDAARQAVASVWSTLATHEKATIAYAFPSEEAWSEEAADEGLRVLAARNAPYINRGDDERVTWLLYTLRDSVRATAVARISDGGYQPNEAYATLLANLGVDAAGPLLTLLGRRDTKTGPEGEFWRRVMSAIESREVAEYFAKHLTHNQTARVAAEYFKRFPSLAVPALEAAANRGSKEAALLLAGLAPARAGADAGATPEAPATNDGDTSPSAPASASASPAAASPAAASPASAANTKTTSTSSVDDTDLSGVPDVLITPPWLTKRARVKPTVLSIEPRSIVSRMDWSDDERNVYQQDEFSHYGGPRTPERDRNWGPKLAGEVRLSSLFHLTDEAMLRVWQTKPVTEWTSVEASHLRCVLARSSTEALPNVVACAYKNAKSITGLERVVSNDVVSLMADAAWRLKDAGRFGETWLLRYPNEAATQLVPAAVGQPGAERNAAEHALRFLAARQQGELVRSVAASYGEACATAIDRMLSTRVETLPTKMPTLPPFWAPALWPRPTLTESGRELPLTAIDHLGIMLAASPLDAPMFALEDVKAACDPASLAAFAWALFEAWQTAGFPSKHVWAFQALGHLGTDDSARQLDPLIRQWPTFNGLGRATIGLDILAAIGSDTALSLLQALSGKKVKSRPLQLRAAQRIQDLANRRGMTSEQLADRLVPDLEFDAAGTCILDFGSRQFRVSLDARLKPEVRTLTGEHLRDLPKPGAHDDEKQAAAAVAKWKAVKKSVTAVVPVQIGRLERAMCESRRWSVPDFVTYIVNHPIVGQLARRVIWTSHDGAAPVVTFRVAEDRTFADAADASFALPANAEIGLLHPLEADAATLAAWTQCMVDYEIIQPFEQLGRAVRRASPEELRSTVISRVDKQTVDTGRVLTLERRGWRRGPNIDSGGAVEMIKPIPAANAEAYLGVSPGIATWLIKEFPRQTLTDVIVARISPTAGIRERIPLSALDPISVSELLADLDSLIT
jgi:hypothetical protein